MAKWYELTAGVTALLALAACGGGSTGTADSGSARQVQGAPAPAPVPLADADRLAAGPENTVGLTAGGQVYVWGRDDNGMVNTKPLLIPGMSGMGAVKSVKAGGTFTLLLKQDGTLAAATPQGIAPIGMSAVQATAIAAGQAHALYLTASGNVWGWGRGSGQSVAGQGNVVGMSSVKTRLPAGQPAIIASLNNVIAIAAGQDYSVALTADGKVWTWGSNLYGQLGNGFSGGTVNTPAVVAGLTNVKAIAAGASHVLVLKDDGTVWGWGNNSYGQLGGTTTVHYRPVAINGLPASVAGATTVRAVAAGAYNSGVVYSNGSVWTWGNNTFGQLGDGTNAVSFAPKKVTAISDAVSMAIGAGHIAVLRGDGAVYSFGSNTAGQLGNNTTAGSNLPVQAVGVGGFGNLNLGKSANR